MRKIRQDAQSGRESTGHSAVLAQQCRSQARAGPTGASGRAESTLRPRPLGVDPALGDRPRPQGSPTAGTWENTGDNVGPSAQQGRVHLAAGLGSLQHKLQTQTSGKIFHAGAQGPASLPLIKSHRLSQDGLETGRPCNTF